VLRTFIWGFPHQYRAPAPGGTAIALQIPGIGAWTLTKTATGWSLRERQPAAPAASLLISGEAAWRLLTGARHDPSQVQLSGDPALTEPLLQVRGIIVYSPGRNGPSRLNTDTSPSQPPRARRTTARDHQQGKGCLMRPYTATACRPSTSPRNPDEPLASRPIFALGGAVGRIAAMLVFPRGSKDGATYAILMFEFLSSGSDGCQISNLNSYLSYQSMVPPGWHRCQTKPTPSLSMRHLDVGYGAVP